MIKLNRIGKLCLAAAVTLILVLSTCVPVWAGVPDLRHKCSITFTMAYDGSALAGGNLKMYRIAAWVIKDGQYDFAWVPELEDAGLNLDDRNSEEFARHVFMLVESRSLPAVTQHIGSKGTVTFSDLDSGLYVVYQTDPAEGFEPINAFCVSLPMQLGEDFVYDVQASPKPRPVKTTTTTPDETVTEPTTTNHDETVTEPTTVNHGETVTEPTTTSVYIPDTPPGISMDEKLPQTGQLWWPTWMLGVFGAILLGLGIVLRMLIRQSAEESEI